MTTACCQGISELILGQQPSFCLTSGGAECIMLNKDFYLQHASEALVRTLRLEVSDFYLQHASEALVRTLRLEVRGGCSSAFSGGA